MAIFKQIIFILFLMLTSALHTTHSIPSTNTYHIVSYDVKRDKVAARAIFEAYPDYLLYPAPWWKRCLAKCGLYSSQKLQQEQVQLSLDYLKSTIYTTHTAQLDDELIGFVNFVYLHPVNQEKIGCIHLIAVHPDHHKKGIGKKLMQVAVEELFDEHKVTSIFFYTKYSNKSMQILGEKLGFCEKLGIKKNHKSSNKIFSLLVKLIDAPLSYQLTYDSWQKK